jgi:transcriptional regulator with XRE-family HTH domain
MTTKQQTEDLSPSQLKAIDLILQGKNDSEVAEALKVNRSTVNLWRNKNASFKALLNNRKNTEFEKLEQSRLNVKAKAYKVLDAYLDKQLTEENPDIKTVLEVLKLESTKVTVLPDDIQSLEKQITFEESLVF